jgi:peptidyl-prolyl cis-trans isomerase SurA
MELGGRVVDPRTGERDLFLEALGPTWRDTIDTLQVDEISYPGAVETLDGKQAYHIVKLTKRVPSHRVDIETDYVRIEQLALRDKQSRVMRQWLDGLREEVFIEMRGKAASLSDNATSVASGRN